MWALHTGRISYVGIATVIFWHLLPDIWRKKHIENININLPSSVTQASQQPQKPPLALTKPSQLASVTSSHSDASQISGVHTMAQAPATNKLKHIILNIAYVFDSYVVLKITLQTKLPIALLSLSLLFTTSVAASLSRSNLSP